MVVDNSTIGLENGFDSPVTLKGFRNLGNSSDGKLCGEPKLLSDFIIHDLLDLHFVRSPHSKGDIGNMVACIIERMHGFKKSAMLLFRRNEFDHECLSHNSEYSIQWLYGYRYG